MAKRSSERAGKEGARGELSGAASLHDRILDAFLVVVERAGWQGVSFFALAREADLPLAQVYMAYHSRAALLAGLVKRTDLATLSDALPSVAGDDSDAPHDRLFEVLMRRFDALGPHREAFRAIFFGVMADPALWLCCSRLLLQSMSWTLESAGISSRDLRGRFQSKALIALYLSVLRTFFGDDSADLSKTMAALDHRLRQALPWLGVAAPNAKMRRRAGAP